MSALSVIGPIEQVGTMILNGPMRFFGLVRSGINSKWAKDFLVQLPGWDSIEPYPREKKKGISHCRPPDDLDRPDGGI